MTVAAPSHGQAYGGAFGWVVGWACGPPAVGAAGRLTFAFGARFRHRMMGHRPTLRRIDCGVVVGWVFRPTANSAVSLRQRRQIQPEILPVFRQPTRNNDQIFRYGPVTDTSRQIKMCAATWIKKAAKIPHPAVHKASQTIWIQGDHEEPLMIDRKFPVIGGRHP